MLEESAKRNQITQRWNKALKKYIPNNRIVINKKSILKNKKLFYHSKGRDFIILSIVDLSVLGILGQGMLTNSGIFAFFAALNVFGIGKGLYSLNYNR